jgi:DnaJ-class molecular chaperone
MNKLAMGPICPHCGGEGRIRVARSLDNAGAEDPRPAPTPAGIGFMWLRCEGCKGEGRR